jgi:glycosyltransferase involved in cell wall biosynthesis
MGRPAAGKSAAVSGAGAALPPPRITIVTPCLNAAAYLEETLDSVLSQGYAALEYVVVDGGSTDGTQDIIRRHEKHLARWVSEPDRGHADALNKGFGGTTGTVMGWLNGDDVLHRGALRLLADLFGGFPDIEWLTAQASNLDESGAVVQVQPPRAWSRLGFVSGDYRWIQQESTYWRRSLWERAGARLSDAHRLACDFELWMRFFRHARLQSCEGLVGGFRMHAGQRTAGQMDAYEREAHEIVLDELRSLTAAGAPVPDDPRWPAAPGMLRFDWRTRSFVRHGETDA